MNNDQLTRRAQELAGKTQRADGKIVRNWSSTPVLACLMAAVLGAPVIAVATEPDTSHPQQLVSESALAAAVKTRLEANQFGRLSKLEVATEADGTVWLSGTSATQEAADRAVETARNMDGVTQVKSTIVVARAAK